MPHRRILEASPTALSKMLDKVISQDGFLSSCRRDVDEGRTQFDIKALVAKRLEHKKDASGNYVFTIQELLDIVEQERKSLIDLTIMQLSEKEVIDYGLDEQGSIEPIATEYGRKVAAFLKKYA